MILLYKVVQIFVLPERDTFFIVFGGIECGQRCRIRATFIDGHHLRFTMMADSLAEETQGGGRITLRRQQEVDGLPMCINRAVQLFPLSPDPDVSFIHSPPAPHSPFMSAERPVPRWDQANGPAVKRGMVNDNPTLSHHFLQIAQAEGISQIPADTLRDNINGIMQALEGFLDQRHGWQHLKKKHVT